MAAGMKINAWTLPILLSLLALRGTAAYAAVTVTGSNLPDDPTLWNNLTTVYLGHAGDGGLLVNAGSSQVTGHAYLGNSPTAVGTVTIDGDSSTLSTNQLFVGSAGTGIMNLTDGGQLHSNGTTIGAQSGSLGTVNVDGPGSLWTDHHNANLFVGYSGTGALHLTHGGTVNGGYLYLGYILGSHGSLTVDGPGSTLNFTGLYMGNGPGTSTLNVSNGGQLITNAVMSTPTYLDDGASVTISGAGSSWQNNNNLILGRTGPSSLVIADQALVQIVGVCNLTNGTLALQDGSLSASSLQVSSVGNFTQTGGTLNVSALFSVGAVNLGGSQSFLNIPNLYLSGGTTTLTPSGTRVLSTAALSLTATAKLDLTNNTLLLHSSNLTADHDKLRASLQSARNGGLWNGPGLTSSLATNSGSELHSLTLMKAADLGLTTFKGQPVDASTLIVTYTLTGDINLDGQITALDFALIDAAFTLTSPNQALALARATADTQHFGPDFLTAYHQALTNTPIPEPASLSLLVLGTLTLLKRRS